MFELLYGELWRFGVDSSTIRLLRKMNLRTKLRTCTNGMLSSWFEVHRGFKQGSPESPIEFVASFNHVLDELCRSGHCYRISTDVYSIFVFADDLLFICNCPIKLQNGINICKSCIDNIDMEANIGKSAVMIVGRYHSELKDCVSFSWGNEKIKVVEKYKYLGVDFVPKMLSPQGWDTHANRIMRNANFAFHKTAPFTMDRKIPLVMRIQNFGSMIKLVYTYALELWEPSTEVGAEMKHSYLKKLLRTIGCSLFCRSQMLYFLTNLQGLDYHREYFRVLYKYRLYSSRMLGPHSYTLKLMDGSSTPYGKWFNSERHNLGSKRLMDKEKVLTSMLTWLLKHRTAYVQNRPAAVHFCR